MRDVFTMGARPIANLNSIHFGSPQHKKTKNLLRGVVKGIGGYGNCRSEEHTSELQSLVNLVCRLLLEKKKKNTRQYLTHRDKHT